MYPRTIRNFNAFVDGVSYLGRVIKGTMPELKLKENDHRGGGMDAPIAIDMGMEKMTAELEVAEWSPELFKLFGNRKRMVLRPFAKGEHDNDVDGFVVTLGGRWSSVKTGDLKPEDDVPLTVMLSCDYYRLERNGETLIEVDVEAGKRIVGGVDQLAGVRAAMGV